MTHLLQLRELYVGAQERWRPDCIIHKFCYLIKLNPNDTKISASKLKLIYKSNEEGYEIDRTGISDSCTLIRLDKIPKRSIVMINK